MKRYNYHFSKKKIQQATCFCLSFKMMKEEEGSRHEKDTFFKLIIIIFW